MRPKRSYPQKFNTAPLCTKVEFFKKELHVKTDLKFNLK